MGANPQFTTAGGPQTSGAPDDEGFVGILIRQAEDILEVASQTCDGRRMAIVVDRQGGMRMLEPDGWSLPGLRAEFGGAVFRIDRRGRTVRVEGFDGTDRCLLQRELKRSGMLRLPA
jgi:hypothetical protein